MDENTNDDSRDDNNPQENAKRLKTTDSGLGKSEDSSASSNLDERTASTSTDDQHGNGDNDATIKFRTTLSIRNRNYRNSHGGTEDDNNELENDLLGEERETSSSFVLFGAEEEEEDEEEHMWEECDEDEDDSSESSDDNPALFSDSPDSDDLQSRENNDSDNDINIDDYPLFKKEMPKDNWFAVSEITNRQLGFSAKLQSRELFQRRCYGSLTHVKRLMLLHKLEGHAGCVNSLNFHPDGSLLASGSDDLKILIWNINYRKPLMKFKTRHKSNVFQSKFLPLTGDLHIVSCARDGQVRLAQLNKEEGVKSARLLGTHRGPCHKLIVLPEQPQIILSAGEDGVVFNHDVRGPKSTKVVTVKEDDREIALYSIHGHPLKSHEFCVSGRDAFVRIYDQRKSNEPAAILTALKKAKPRSYRNHVTCAVYNHDGSEILATYSDDDIYLFDVNDTEPGNYIHKYQGHRNNATIKGVNFFGPKSEYVVSGSDCGHIYFWDRNTEALIQWLLADDNGVVNCLEPHPQFPLICTSGLDWDIKVWTPTSKDEPDMEGLRSTVRKNIAKRSYSNDPCDINDSQMLWMLWRHLRSSRLRASNSSGSDSVSNGYDSDDEFFRAPNCSTS